MRVSKARLRSSGVPLCYDLFLGRVSVPCQPNIITYLVRYLQISGLCGDEPSLVLHPMLPRYHCEESAPNEPMMILVEGIDAPDAKEVVNLRL